MDYLSGGGLTGNSVLAILIDEEGKKSFGTANAGLTRLSVGHVKRAVCLLLEGLGGGTVQAIALDRQGNVWFGTNGGVSVLSREAN